jgi:hypothetical protein
MPPARFMEGDHLLDVGSERQVQRESRCNMFKNPSNFHESSEIFNSPGDDRKYINTGTEFESNPDFISDIKAALANPQLLQDGSQKDLQTLQSEVSNLFERDINFVSYDGKAGNIPSSEREAIRWHPLQGQRQNPIKSRRHSTVSKPGGLDPQSIMNASGIDKPHLNFEIIAYKGR